MTFSVILPTHNGAPYIRTMLDSIAAQTYKDYELIVICDACTDDTARIALEYTSKVIEIDAHNAGLARTAGLDAASGDWILFADDDDYFLHEFAFQLIADKLGDEDVLCFSFIQRGIRYATPLGNSGHVWPAVWNKCWRRSFIGPHRFQKVFPDDDLVFSNEMFALNPKVKIWDMPLYYYNYMRPGSITHTLYG